MELRSIPTATFDTAPKAQPSAGSFNQPITFSALAHDPEGAPVTYTWNFGDNTTGPGASVQHQYAAGGTYVIVLTVSDGTTSTAAAPLNLTLTDGAPIVNTLPFAQPKPASFNQPVTFTASAHDPDGLPLTYMWDFGDNTAGGTGGGQRAKYWGIRGRAGSLSL